MESKKDRTIRILKNNKDLLLCPVCGEYLNPSYEYTLTCQNSHSFDISKKGTINLFGGGNQKLYDSNLFDNRRTVIKSGFYKPVTDYIQNIISDYTNQKNTKARILDAGCGEGSFLNIIGSAGFEKELCMGIDLSKEGIGKATENHNDILWLIDDLANIHIRQNSVNIILNILSPANYEEFGRILHKDGLIIKVTPGSAYLKEVRDSIININHQESESAQYSTNFMNVLDIKNFHYYCNTEKETFLSILNMTPMTHNKKLKPLNKKAYGITIDLNIIIGKAK